MVDLSAVIVPMKHEDKFEEFWSLYPKPRRVEKVKCRQKWQSIVGPTGLRTRTFDKDAGSYMEITLSAAPEAIIAGLKRSCEEWRGSGENRYGWKEDGKFIPLPLTWLNQGRWED
jgi:hypothetical protein